MATQLERRLREFVDRKSETATFCQILDGTDPRRVMVVVGPGGIGKSSLLAKMLHECAVRNAQRAEIIYTGDNVPDYLAVMRKCRDDLGVEPFGDLTRLINYYTVPQYEVNLNITGTAPQINIGTNMDASGAQIGQMAGIVVDMMNAQPRTDLSVTEGERRGKLTKAFITALATLKSGLLVIFFDAAEKMTKPTQEWLLNELITNVADADLAHVRFVICTRETPPINRFIEDIFCVAELKPLAVEDVIEYLERRGHPDVEKRPIVAETLLQVSEGNLLTLGNMVDRMKARGWK
jgi:hypothetical protein